MNSCPLTLIPDSLWIFMVDQLESPTGNFLSLAAWATLPSTEPEESAGFSLEDAMGEECKKRRAQAGKCGR